jgi:hypothetical protein
MKKRMMSLATLTVAAFTISTGLFAHETMAPTINMKMDTKKDHCVMRHGKMYVMKDGKKTLMDKTMTFSNGMECNPDGTCKMKDGTTMKMKNGDMMDMDGNMMKTHKKGAMGTTKM